jgi:hypothetical protein
MHQKSGQIGKQMVNLFSAVAADVRRLTSPKSKIINNRKSPVAI